MKIIKVLEILELAAKKRVSVHVAKNHIIMDGSMQVQSTILGLVAQIEREFISCRIKEALAKRKKDGIKLVRPKGQVQFLKLDNYRDEILKYLHKGINKKAINCLSAHPPPYMNGSGVEKTTNIQDMLSLLYNEGEVIFYNIT